MPTLKKAFGPIKKCGICRGPAFRSGEPPAMVYMETGRYGCLNEGRYGSSTGICKTCQEGAKKHREAHPEGRRRRRQDAHSRGRKFLTPFKATRSCRSLSTFSILGQRTAQVSTRVKILCPRLYSCAPCTSPCIAPAPVMSKTWNFSEPALGCACAPMQEPGALPEHSSGCGVERGAARGGRAPPAARTARLRAPPPFQARRYAFLIGAARGLALLWW